MTDPAGRESFIIEDQRTASAKVAGRDPERVCELTTECCLVLTGFSKLVIGLTVSVLAFTNPARDADAEERILTGQEKAAVLAEIAERFREFPSIGLTFEFRQLISTGACPEFRTTIIVSFSFHRLGGRLRE